MHPLDMFSTAAWVTLITPWKYFSFLHLYNLLCDDVCKTNDLPLLNPLLDPLWVAYYWCPHNTMLLLVFSNDNSSASYLLWTSHINIMRFVWQVCIYIFLQNSNHDVYFYFWIAPNCSTKRIFTNTLQIMFKFSYAENFIKKGDDSIDISKKLWDDLTLVIPGQACQTQLHILLYPSWQDFVLLCLTKLLLKFISIFLSFCQQLHRVM